MVSRVFRELPTNAFPLLKFLKFIVTVFVSEWRTFCATVLATAIYIYKITKIVRAL